jgi:hypothetical protein
MRENINSAALVEITSISVDKSLPQNERQAEFRRQIKDPLHYKCGGFTIKAVHPNNGMTIEDCLRGMMA